jgi:hypothetical protein
VWDATARCSVAWRQYGDSRLPPHRNSGPNSSPSPSTARRPFAVSISRSHAVERYGHRSAGAGRSPSTSARVFRAWWQIFRHTRDDTGNTTGLVNDSRTNERDNLVADFRIEWVALSARWHPELRPPVPQLVPLPFERHPLGSRWDSRLIASPSTTVASRSDPPRRPPLSGRAVSGDEARPPTDRETFLVRESISFVYDTGLTSGMDDRATRLAVRL